MLKATQLHFSSPDRLPLIFPSGFFIGARPFDQK
jgi:hypothetical protein